ncbi:MAG TPA: HD domain-containing phosphohydrolase, partial [Desulfobacteria bacterium]|nr:HD domain-containing phosphohydrolase [Desulfobacteria bacterium]
KFLYRNRDEEIILMKLLEIFDKRFGCSAAGAYLFEKGSFLLKAKIHGENSPDANIVLKDVLDAEFIMKYQNENCRPVLMEDNSSLIFLGFEEKVCGLLIYNNVGNSSDMADLICLLAIHTAIALTENEHYNQTEVIEQMAADFASSLDMRIYFPRFIQNLNQIIYFDRLTITIPDPLHLNQLLVYGNNINYPLETTNLASEGNAPAWVISTGKHILEEDLRGSKMFSESVFSPEAGIRCALYVPLVSKGIVVGTLNIGTRIPHYYKKRHVHLLTEVADRIGPTVENALIYQSVNNNLEHALFQLDQHFYETLNAFAFLLERRDNVTKGHSLRVINYSVIIAKRLGIKGQQLEQLRLGALLHDIGKIGIPDAILLKTEKLTEEEWRIMETHPLLGAEMLSKINFLSSAVPVVLHHHERFDGGGYPSKLIGEQVPLLARIFSIADAFDAITSKRPYRDIQSVDNAISELKRCTGTQFCPTCMEAFLSIPKNELVEIYNECTNKIAFKNPFLVGQEFQKQTI